MNTARGSPGGSSRRKWPKIAGIQPAPIWCGTKARLGARLYFAEPLLWRGTRVCYISFFFFPFILSSCILIRMLMNPWLPQACIHQLTLINKMCGGLAAGFSGRPQGRLFRLCPGRGPSSARPRNKACSGAPGGVGRGSRGACKHTAALIYYELSFWGSPNSAAWIRTRPKQGPAGLAGAQEPRRKWG